MGGIEQLPPPTGPPLSAPPESEQIRRRARNSRAAIWTTLVMSALLLVFFLVTAGATGSYAAAVSAGRGSADVVLTALVMLAVSRYGYSGLPWPRFAVVIVTIVTYVLVLGFMFNLGSSGRKTSMSGTHDTPSSMSPEMGSGVCQGFWTRSRSC